MSCSKKCYDYIEDLPNKDNPLTKGLRYSLPKWPVITTGSVLLGMAILVIIGLIIGACHEVGVAFSLAVVAVYVVLYFSMFICVYVSYRDDNYKECFKGEPIEHADAKDTYYDVNGIIGIVAIVVTICCSSMVGGAVDEKDKKK